MVQHYPKLEKHFLSFIREGDAEGMRSLWDNHLGESQRNIFRSTTFEGVSPLFLAASLGHLEISKVLVARGADVNQESGDDSSPWLIACEKGHLDIVELFVEDGQDIEFTHSDVEFFVENGQNIEFTHSNGYTALIIASAFGKTNVGHFLLSKGARVGLPALFFAAKEGHLEMCKELVARGADANQKSDNSSPWLEACAKGHLNIGDDDMEKETGLCQ
uniref:ANK_REP_REGION domain-containing protein n=1 Tax=Globodera pallida TaxID=36090 RepID=A0A183C4V1_GLOPA